MSKLEWRFSSDGERCFANVPEGQLIMSKTLMGLWLCERHLFGFKVSLSGREKNKKHPLEIAYSTHGEAQAAIELWYSTRKEKATECPPKSTS
jgi:hypothetical protein